jgi:DNA polymerase-3 subunit epsilon
MESFIAIDYETANSDRRSACSLGVSVVNEGVITNNFQTLIKPPKEFNYFDDFNVMIHGITQSDVKNSPDFSQVWAHVTKLNVNNLPLVCHNSGFDIRLTQDLVNYFQIAIEEISYFDTLTIAKKLWPHLINHKLSTLAHNFGFDLQHHNAASDSEVCAKIALQQMKELEKASLLEVAKNYGFLLGTLSAAGISTMSASKNYNYKKDYANYSKNTSSKDVTPDREVNVGSDLFGAYLVFTGELITMGRKEAIQIAVNNGAIVSTGVTKKTQYLVVGVSDFIDFSNGKKTRKLLDAEKLSVEGQDISIIDEEDFIRMSSY